LVSELNNSKTTTSKKDKVRVIRDSYLKKRRREINAAKAAVEDFLLKLEMDKANLKSVFIPTESSARTETKAAFTTTTHMGVEEMHQETQKDEVEMEQMGFYSPKKVAKALHSKKWVKYYKRLYYYLKCKYFMSPRDQTTFRYMLQDARTWMLKAGNSCESEEDFIILSSSIQAAFLVDERELETREIMKEERNIDAMRKINEFSKGNLGNLPMRGPLKKIGLGTRAGTSITFENLPKISC
jgi:hypothetical protein